jgi:hypothetical protein
VAVQRFVLVRLLVFLATVGFVVATAGLADPALSQTPTPTTNTTTTPVVSPVPTVVRPAPPPGVGQAVATILSWIWWLAGMGIAGGFAWGAFNWAKGDVETGKRYITWSLLAFIALAFFYYITSGLIGG